MQRNPPSWFFPVGRGFYAAAVIFFGVQHLIYGNFVTRIMPAWPAWIPGAPFWAYLFGGVLITAGGALFFARTARRAALALGALILLGAVLLALPTAAAHASWGGEWTSAGKAFALGGGALVIAGLLRPEASSGPLLIGIGRICLCGFLVLGGIQHFVWAKFVAQLVPAWVPSHLFWTYFAGVALIAGGLGMLLPATARRAARLTALMIFLWVILLHIPRALADLHNANESTAVFEALAMSGIALLLAVAADWRAAGNSSR